MSLNLGECEEVRDGIMFIIRQTNDEIGQNVFNKLKEEANNCGNLRSMVLGVAGLLHDSDNNSLAGIPLLTYDQQQLIFNIMQSISN